MVLHAYDGAYLRAVTQVKAVGGIAMNLYVSGMYAVPTGYANTVRAAGVGCWPNYEVGLWELVSNKAAGEAAARRGVADAIRAGFPADGTIWFPFSVDVNVPPSRYGEVGAAFDGINAVVAGRFLVGCYGQGGLIDYLHNTGRTHAKGWLSSSSSYPGFNPASPNVCLVQQHDANGNWINTDVPNSDINTITDVANLHAWWPAKSKYGADMPLSASDLSQVRSIVDDIVQTKLESFLNDPYHDYLPSLHKKIAAAPGQNATAVWSTPIPTNAGTLTAAQRIANPPAPLDPATIDQVAAKIAAALPAVTPEQIKAALSGHQFTGTTTLTAQ
jgi:hypothetical protein